MKAKDYQDEEAFQALQNGKEKGLLYFFDRYYSPLLLYTSSITHHHNAAQEIVSDTFHKLWLNRRHLAARTNIKAYLYRIASNAAIDYLRRKKSERKRNSLYVVNDADEHTVLQKMIETEVYDQLYQALHRLPEKPRRIFELFYFEKKSIHDIASELGTTPDAVKSQKKRAMQLLREHQKSLSILIIAFIIFGM